MENRTNLQMVSEQEIRDRLAAIPDPKQVLTRQFINWCALRGGRRIDLREFAANIAEEIQDEPPEAQHLLRTMMLDIACAHLSPAQADTHRATLAILLASPNFDPTQVADGKARYSLDEDDD